MFTLLLAVLLQLAPVSVPAAPADAQADGITFIRIGTGPIGGSYFPVGGLIANVISGPPGSMPCDLGGSCGVPDLIAAAVSTEGSVENVHALATGHLDMALCQANIAHDAFTGSGPFAGKPMNSLRTIGNLFPEMVHVVVRVDSKIDSIGQLKGRRVSLGETNSGTFVTARLVLRAYGLSPNDLKPVYEKLARSAEMLMSGEIDAFFMVGGQPLDAVVHAAERTDIALLPIGHREAERSSRRSRSSASPSFRQTPTGASVPPRRSASAHSSWFWQNETPIWCMRSPARCGIRVIVKFWTAAILTPGGCDRTRPCKGSRCPCTREPNATTGRSASSRPKRMTETR
ncbi:MAG: TAXI family TRAP transporter solute-binding subunit [Defluviicoccus sp.]|nr:MAG: TAXI family TRAP transporter solute-binding subunit [Defluviicoccus sp.]